MNKMYGILAASNPSSHLNQASEGLWGIDNLRITRSSTTAFTLASAKQMCASADVGAMVAYIHSSLENGTDLCAQLKEISGGRIRTYYVARSEEEAGSLRKQHDLKSAHSPINELYIEGTDDFDSMVRTSLLYLEGLDLNKPV